MKRFALVELGHAVRINGMILHYMGWADARHRTSCPEIIPIPQERWHPREWDPELTWDDVLVPGQRLIFYPWPEEGIDFIEVGVIESIAAEERIPGEGREALVRIPSELRDPDDRDGMREVFFDEECLLRLEAF